MNATTPDYTTVAAKRPTDELMLAVAYSDKPAITTAAIRELRTRDDYRALVDTDHADAIELFEHAKTADSGYRMTRTGDPETAIDAVRTSTLGSWMLRPGNVWVRAIAMDELRRRAIGRYRVDATNRIADMIRAHQLDGQDVRDIAASVDAGELDYIGAGVEVHACVLSVTKLVDVSAAGLLDYVTVYVLGW